MALAGVVKPPLQANALSNHRRSQCRNAVQFYAGTGKIWRHHEIPQLSVAPDTCADRVVAFDVPRQRLQLVVGLLQSGNCPGVWYVMTLLRQLRGVRVRALPLRPMIVQLFGPTLRVVVVLRAKCYPASSVLAGVSTSGSGSTGGSALETD